MNINGIPPYNPNMQWNIIRQSSKYGGQLVKTTEYYPNNGLKLLVVEKFKNGKLIEKAKTLFDKNWQMIKKKVRINKCSNA